MENVDRPTTRRALLAAAAGGVAALAAQAAAPLAVSATDPNDLVLNTINATNAPTGVTTPVGTDAFAVETTSGTGSALVAHSGAQAAVRAISGAVTDAAAPTDTTSTGVYGYTPATAPTAPPGAGVWGDSDDIGVYGTGGVGVFGDGNVGVEGDGSGAGGIGVLGFAATAGTIGVHAQGAQTDRTALRVTGKVVFSRSGRTTIGAEKASKVVAVAGVTTSSLVFAMLSTNRAGRWVRAVVPAAGKFTVLLNTTVPGTTAVVWWILN